MGPWLNEGKEWLNQLGQKIIIEVTGDIKVKNCLMQIISMVFKRELCLCVASILPVNV